MSPRVTLAERRVRLSRTEHLAIAATQGPHGGLVVSFTLELQGSAQREVASFDVPPRAVRPIAAALEALAGELGLEP